MQKTLLPLMLAGLAGLAQAAVVVEKVPYAIAGEPYEGLLVYDERVTTPRPGLLMVPNWLGVTEAAAQMAARLAGERYVVFVADMYGRAIRPANAEEAAASAGHLRSDRGLMRQRAVAALEQLQRSSSAALVPGKVAAAGFCFGGGVVLELARSGAPLAAFVSFHGNLDTPTPADARQIKAPVLVLHGAADPYVPPAQVQAFIAEMEAGGVDWQLVSYGGAVHSFTDPQANVPGSNQYDPRVARRAFQAMDDLLAEVFAAH